MLLVIWAGASCVLPLVYRCLECIATGVKRSENHGLGKILDRKATWLVAGGVLWLVYMICYVSYFPGVFRYDAVAQTEQALGKTSLSNFQPVLHTMIWKMFLLAEGLLTGGTGEGNLALALYSVVQLTAVVALSTYVAYRIYKIFDNGILSVLGLAYYLCVPTLHIFSFIMTKDVYFACCTTLFLMGLYNLGNGENAKLQVFWCVLWGLCSTLLRNNMVYAVVIGVIAALLLRAGRRTCLSLFMVVAFNVLLADVMYPALGIADTPSSEALSVPISQVAYVYENHYDSLGDEDRAAVETYIGEPYKYNARFADFVKSSFNNAWYVTDSGSFWKCYFSLMRQYPGEYLTVFLDLNVDLWYLDAPFPDPYSNREYIETGVQYTPYYGVTPRSFLWRVNYLYEKAAGFESRWMRLPVIRWYYSLAFPFMLMLFCLYARLKRVCAGGAFGVDVGRKALVVLAVLAALFATYLLGPVAVYRYMYVFYYILPWLLGISMR
jgi:hypothetical protein